MPTGRFTRAGYAWLAAIGTSLLLAFAAIGGAEAALYAARDYALERKAFGRPIGSF